MRSDKEGLTAHSYVVTLMIAHCFTSSSKPSSDDVCRKAYRLLVTVSRHCSVNVVVVHDKFHMLRSSSALDGPSRAHPMAGITTLTSVALPVILPLVVYTSTK